MNDPSPPYFFPWTVTTTPDGDTTGTATDYQYIAEVLAAVSDFYDQNEYGTVNIVRVPQ